jgi:parallel beta-helix repeat protein
MNTTLQKLILICSLLFVVSRATAVDYYFSNEIGNDFRSSSQAQNPDTPWKSIDKLNAIFSSLSPGDAVYFRRGEVYFGTIRINKGGSAGSPIKIDAYGSGSKPIITSFARVNGWRSIGNGRYESINSFPNIESNVVSINGQLYERGRYPNSDEDNGGYLTITSKSGNSSVSSNELSTSENFSGGEVVIRKNQWVIDRHFINWHSGNTINYAGTGNYFPSEGFGFFIQNHLSTLDKFGEWFYNQNRKLVVYFGNSNPNNFEVEMGTSKNILVKVNNESNVLVQNLHFKGSTNDAIYMVDGRDVTINNVEVDFAGENGINLVNVQNIRITNCNINSSLNNGILLKSNNNNSVIKDNVIENTFPFSGGVQNENGNGNGIFANGDNILIENNVLRQSGFNGVDFKGNDITIKNNLVEGYCLLKNDCGGVYTYGGQSVRTFRNLTIEGNIIVGGNSTNNGTPHHKSQTVKSQSSGIFLDDNANGLTIIGNTTADNQYAGIKIQNSFNINVNGNTFYDSYAATRIINSERAADTRNVNFTNNVLFSMQIDQTSYSIRSFKNDITNFGFFNNNYFARPLGDDHSIYTSYLVNGDWVLEVDNLDSWNQRSNKDWSSSLFEQNAIDQFKFNGYTGGLLYDNVSFNNGITGFNCSDCSQSWDANGINGGSAKIQNTVSGSSAARVRINSVIKDKNYVVKFKAKSNVKRFLRLALRYAGSPWEIISPSTTIEVGTGVAEYSVLIKPYDNVEEPVLMFISEEGNWEYWIDDLEIREADVEIVNPDNVFLFEYNPSKTQKSIPLNGTFKDVKGNTYSESINIEPYGSVLLVRTSEADNPIQNFTQEINIISPGSNSNFNVGQEIIIEAQVSPNNENISKVEFYSDDQLIGSATEQPYKLSWNSGGEKTHQITAVIVNDNNEYVAVSESVPVTINPNNQVDDGNSTETFALHVNVGSDQEEIYDGKNFVPLQNTNIQTGNFKNSVFLKNPEGSIFKTDSYSSELNYKIPVPNGFYTVQTFHQEVYFGIHTGGGEGIRVFDILIEDQNKYQDLDLYALNRNQVVVLTFENIQVRDGYLDLNLIASKNNSLLSGFSVIKEENPTSEPVASAKFINVGGDTDESYNGDVFVSDFTDNYFSASQIYGVASVSQQPIFQSTRYAKNLVYKIPVENGFYQVKTYHIENYFGVINPSAGAGIRVFDIFIQNLLVKKDLDLYAYNTNKEITMVFDDIEVQNGELIIELNASGNNALLAGIAIIPTGVINDEMDDYSYFINTGSDISTEYNGVNFVAENSLIPIPANSRPYIVPNSSSIQMYQSHRYGKSLNYEFPVPDGKYTVVTYHNESYFGEIISNSGPNVRVFDISIEGQEVKSDVDLYKENSNNPVAFRFEEIQVSDGILNLNLNAQVNNALLSGVAVFPSLRNNLGNANLRQIIAEVDEMEILSEMNSSGIQDNYENKLYPNPATTSAILQIGQDLGNFYISIHNFNGQLINYFDSQILLNAQGNYEIPVSQLKQGVYIITLSSETDIYDRLRLTVTP